MNDTTLTPAQLAAARVIIAAEDKAKADETVRKMTARAVAYAKYVAAEALHCAGVVTAEVETAGFYVGCAGVKLTFDGLRKDSPYYLVCKLDGYTDSAPIKLSTKVRPGYKTGSRTFKSIPKAVAASRKFATEIQASVDAWMAREGR